MAKVVAVRIASDVHVARQTAKEMACTIGFDEKSSEEIAIAVKELASNLFRHAQGGALSLQPISKENRAGIQIESEDHGPGITDVERAIGDGFSTAGSLGCGLGAVNRFMDQIDIRSECRSGPGINAGTTIVCRRWVPPQLHVISDSTLDFGVATRAYPGMTANGDAFVIKKWGANALVAVIDGLGHGPAAHTAAQAARHYLETHCEQPLDALFLGVARTCRVTRGVVMAVAQFTFDGLRTTFSFASIGNVEVRMFGSSTWKDFVLRRGVLGGHAPNPKVTEHSWPRGATMVMHSDGMTTHWGLESYPDLIRESASAGAQGLLRVLGKQDDDATVVVVKDGMHDT